MAINTTTFESTLQTKLNDTTLAAKEMLLLGKALEATSGNIAVSNVTAEGTTQVARVVAAMTGALPAQSGQAGKVLTSDGTDSSWQEGLPSQTGQSAKFLTTDGTSANWEALSSSALSANFTVAAGKTVSAGTVASLYQDKIGENPIANPIGAESSHSAQTFELATTDGAFLIRAYSDSSNGDAHTVEVLRTSDMANMGTTVVSTSYTNRGTSIRRVSSNRFVVYGYGSTNNGYNPRTCGSGYYGAYNMSYQWYMVMLEISSTGNVTYGNTWTKSTSAHGSSGVGMTTYSLDDGKEGRAGFRWSHANHVSSCNGNPSSYYTFPVTGSLNISTTGADSTMNNFNYESIFNTASNKIIQPSTSTSWNTADWNGSVLTNNVSIPVSLTNINSSHVIKPDPTQDKLLAFYINSNLELAVETLTWTSGAVTIDAGTKVVIEADASGVSLGKVKGSAAGVCITYENGSKGRLKSLSLDSNMKVTGTSALATVSNNNVSPQLEYEGNDTFRTWFNDTDCFSRNVTVNAYSTSPLKPVGVITSNASAGTAVDVITTGVAGGFTGLSPDTKYYYDVTDYQGNLTTTDTGVLIGRAISTTELLLTDLTEQ
jgi:hypothetical protein